jgi:enoyl-CoA hydratase/carnithine racemase
MQGTVMYELSDGVAWLGLNRPRKRNAIGEALLAELEAAVGRAQDEARALVVFGHGPCFSAGLDLAEQSAREPVEVFHHSRAMARGVLLVSPWSNSSGAGSNWPLPATSA